MSQRCVALAMVLLSSAPLGAQTVFLGARAGYVAARQVDDFGPSSALPGASGGFAALLELTTWFGVEANLLYTQKGWRMGQTWRGLDYMELPVLLRFAIPLTDIDAGPDPGLQPFVVAGLTHSILLSCYGPVMDVVNSGNTDLVLRTSSAHQFPAVCSQYFAPDADNGITLGGGVTLRRASSHFTFEVRKTEGLENLVENPHYGACGRCRIRNRAVQILIGATLRVSK